MCRSGLRSLHFLLLGLVFYCWPIYLATADHVLSDQDYNRLNQILLSLQTNSSEQQQQLKQQAQVILQQSATISESQATQAKQQTAISDLAQTSQAQQKTIAQSQTAIDSYLTSQTDQQSLSTKLAQSFEAAIKQQQAETAKWQVSTVVAAVVAVAMTVLAAVK